MSEGVSVVAWGSWRDICQAGGPGRRPRIPSGSEGSSQRAAGGVFGCPLRAAFWTWACSSAGQSARLISVRSAVQIGPGPPHRRG
jgi:hypothetical protein